MKKILALLTAITLVVIIFIAAFFYIKSGAETDIPSENINPENVEKDENSTDKSKSNTDGKKDSTPEKVYYTYVPTRKIEENNKDSSYKKGPDGEKAAKKSKVKKHFQKISLGENENLYVSKDGKAWYVRKNPDGTYFKSEVAIDEETGEVTFLTEVEENAPKLEKIVLGENDTLYITDKGEQWHVSKNEEGETVKERIEVDEDSGEIKVLETYSSGKRKDSSD